MNITDTERLSQKLVGFPPIVGKLPRIMILGSMPSVKSLNKQQYYGHPSNQFWVILATLLRCEASEYYEDKKQMLTNNNIALWDAVHHCRRNGSLDSNLKDVKTNDFKHVFEEHSTLKAVFCNGQTAYKLFKRYNDGISLPIIALPSTSSAYTLSFDKKLIQWRKILEFI